MGNQKHVCIKVRNYNRVLDTINNKLVSIFVTVVRQVVRNDSNKGTVVQHGAVPILVKIIDTGNVEEQRGKYIVPKFTYQMLNILYKMNNKG